MKNAMIFNGVKIGKGEPVYFVAEVSANHNQSYERAVEVIRAAKMAGANAVKLQTYTADTITIDSNEPCFQVKGGTLWDGATLYDIYSEAYTPWEWHSDLKKVTEEMGMAFFSSPFDHSAVDFLESIEVQSYKIASSELIDISLLEAVGKTKKPVLLSCGMASLAEIEEALDTLFGVGCDDVVLLKCTAAYPAQPDEMNLLTLKHMASTFGVPVGLSDHSMGHLAAVTAVALGACVIEKHLTLKRSDGGPDSGFSMEPEEFAEMIRCVRIVEKALGETQYGATESEQASKQYRRSLFVCEPIAKGERLTYESIRSIRPGIGLHPRHIKEVIGKRARKDLAKGTPLDWMLIE